jgi:predicted RNA binding protein YcfA (HicA-like mRNA interferase family)
MKSLSGKEFEKIVRQHGWILLRIQGSHHIYGKPGFDARLSIPVHKNNSLKIGLLKHLIKLAEIPLESI